MNELSVTCRFSLADLLRTRRKLPVQEVIHLLDGVARTRLDHVVGLSLRTICVEIDATAPERDWHALEVTTWPAFRVSILPLEIAATDIDKTRVPGVAAGSAPSILSQFASVVYELLGGRNAAFPSLRTPLTALNEEANHLLLEAMRTRSSEVRPFWQSWVDACGHSAPQEKWRIPKWASHLAYECESIDLLPETADILPIRLSARSQYRIGRSRSSSDFALHFGEGDPVNAATLSRISRIHVLAERSSGGIVLRDGDGTKATVNGSTFDGTPLSPVDGHFITAGGILKLAGIYELEVLLVRSPLSGREWEIENAGRVWPDDTVQDFSSLRLRAVRGGSAREAIWIFTMAGLVLNSAHQLEWTNHESDAYFIRSANCFWIVNAQLDASRIRVDDAGVNRRQIVPLRPGQTLELGESRFTVSAESSKESA